ncbi:hypothetical protein CQA49_09835, partial [Helicobacter sp. MIT 00-7814]
NENDIIAEFGTNYAEFYHDGKGAIKKLLSEKQGQVAGAYEKDGLDLALVWGEYNPQTKQGIGLSKIYAKHLDDFKAFVGDTPEEKLANGMSEIVENGRLINVNGVESIVLNKNGLSFRLGLSKGWNNQGENRWIITAYKSIKESGETSYHDTFTAREPLANLNNTNSTTPAKINQPSPLELALKHKEQALKEAQDKI